MSLKAGQRVSVKERGFGTIAYIGKTSFAEGKWIGVILDKPLGKNNGTIQGKEYFKCEENYGMMVRQQQIALIDVAGNPLPMERGISSPMSSSQTSLDESTKPRAKLSSVRRKASPAQQASEMKFEKLSSRVSLIGSRSPSDLGSREGSPSLSKESTTSIQQPPESLTVKRASFVEQQPVGDSPGVGADAGTDAEHGNSPTSSKQASGIPSLMKPSKLTPPTNFRRASSGSQSSSATPKRPQTVPLAQADGTTEQTGFVETLKPQFTPGQVLASPGSSLNSSLNTSGVTNLNQFGGSHGGGLEEKIAHLQLQQENEQLKKEIRDLNEKLETLKVKRIQDKEQLREFEKTKTQLESMMEFKVRIMESQTALQRDLLRAKQEAREAIEAKDAHAEEMSDLAETMEMATLDKEMAEEKAETLQVELEQAREKIEELTVDLELLRAQMSEDVAAETGNQESSQTSFRLKQLEQQNARLHETILRFRDVSAHDKHELQKLQKELDQRKSENLELSRTKEKLSTRVEELEAQVADLQEQVDAALGAEDMVEQLLTKKMNLEDKVTKLEEEVLELEQLQDMNEQLAESSRELEIELREEADLAKAAVREAVREKEAALETLADREQTISKFREVVQRLQEQNQELQQQLERETSRPVTALPDMLDFKKMLAESKAHTRAIDLELRRIEVQESQKHVQYLTAYMPDSFMARGGDHDAVLMLLLVPRLLWKSELLLSQVKDKFAAVESVDRAGLLRGHAVDQYVFRCRLTQLLSNAQCILHQYLHSLNSCSPETLLKVGAAFPDMAVQEKVFDNFLELLRKDQLDENVTMENLERCVTYLTTMFPIVLGTDIKINQSQTITDIIRSLSAAVECTKSDAAAVLALAKKGEENGEMCSLASYLITECENLLAQLKTARRHLPQGQQEGAISNLGIDASLVASLQECCMNQAAKLTRVLRDIVRSAVMHISTTGDADSGVPLIKLSEFAALAASDTLDQEEGGPGPVESIRAVVDLLLQKTMAILSALQACDYEAGSVIKPEQQATPPIELRAQAVRRELEETKLLTQRLEARDADLRELRKIVKDKQEELSQAQLRKEMVERKLENLTKESNATKEKLERKLDDAYALLKRKEKEFEETMDHLQADIDSLETERGELKEKLKTITKKAVESGTKSVAAITSAASPSHVPSLPRTPSSLGVEAPVQAQELHALRQALLFAANENTRLRVRLAEKRFPTLKPIPVPKRLTSEGDRNIYGESTLDELIKRASKLKKDVLEGWALPRVVDISKRGPCTPPSAEAAPATGTPPVSLLSLPAAKQLIREKQRIQDLKMRTEQLRLDVLAEAARRKRGGLVEGDFTSFPSKELAETFAAKDVVSLGEIRIPILDENTPSENVTVFLDPASLQDLQKKLLMLCS